MRYAYETEQNGIKLHLVVDEFNNGKKVFDYYSNRNFIEADKGHSLKSAHNEIIPQSNKNGNMQKAFVTFFADPLLPPCVVMYVSKHTSLTISFLKFFTKNNGEYYFDSFFLNK